MLQGNTRTRPSGAVAVNASTVPGRRVALGGHLPPQVPSLHPHSHVRVLVQGGELVLHPARGERGWGGTGHLSPSPGFGEALGKRGPVGTWGRLTCLLPGSGRSSGL